jgi:putative hemolysin
VLPQIGLVLVLVVLNAAFAGSEMALVSLREGQLQRLEARSRRGAVLARLVREPNQFLATIQIGITLAGFLASAAAAVSLAEPLVEPLGFLGGAARPVAVVLVTLVLAYVTLVFGELAPKRVAMQRAERWGLLAARPLAFMARLTRPAVWLLSVSTDVAVRLLGGDPSRGRDDVTEEELRDLVATQVSFSPQQRAIIDGAFEVADRSLQEVLRPRGEVFVVDAVEPAPLALRQLLDSGHSRAPVAISRNLDEVLGVVHLRQLVDGGEQLAADLAVEVPVLPESAGVLDALRQLQTARQQLAIVANEHGGIEGIVTVEDLVEEVVGEIYDETDRDVLSAVHNPDGSLTLTGRFPVHDLDDVGVDLPEGPYATIAGLVLDRLGRIPDAPGDVVEVDGWRLEVTGTARRSITEVHLSPLEGPPADPADRSAEER